jgi:sugar phosphate isomerase/epimerase
LIFDIYFLSLSTNGDIMNKFKLAVFTDEVSHDFQTAINFAQEFHLDGVDIRGVWKKGPHELTDADIQRMQEILSRTNLKVASIASPFFKCNLDSATEYGQHLDILKRCIHLAKTFGTNIIRVFTFWRTGELTDDIINTIVEKYQKPIAIATEAGITLAIENEFACSIADGEELARLLEKLQSSVMKAVWDPQNAFYKLKQYLADLGGYDLVKQSVVHVHVKDAKLAAPGKVTHAELGKGEVNIQGLLNALARDNYSDFVSLETHWRVSQADSGEQASRICIKNLIEMTKAI